MDHLSKERRSWNMSRIRGTNTKPELTLRSLLHRAGFRFTLNNRLLPGRPDIVLPKYNTAIFVHGCFWHRHKNCSLAYTPKSRTEFWTDKFESNVARDQRNLTQLKALGWKTIVVWECQLKTPGKVISRIGRRLIGAIKAHAK